MSNYKLSSKSSREDMCRLPTSFLLNIQSCVKQEVDMPQIQNCVTRYSSPYWCSVPNIRKLACVVPEKKVTEIILWANLPMSTILKVVSNRKWTCRRFKTALHDTVLHTDALCPLSGSWPVWFPRKMWQKFFVTPTTTAQDDRSDPYMSPLLKRAGDTTKHNISIGKCACIGTCIY